MSLAADNPLSRFGTYYGELPEWTHPDGTKADPEYPYPSSNPEPSDGVVSLSIHEEDFKKKQVSQETRQPLMLTEFRLGIWWLETGMVS
jgi:hypothetical protein